MKLEKRINNNTKIKTARNKTLTLDLKEKQEFKNKVIPEWIKKAKIREDKYSSEKL